MRKNSPINGWPNNWAYLFSISWGHHRFLMDRYSKEPAKAFYYVRKTIEEGWSRDVMLNHMDSNLYEREGKALTNFKTTLPAVASELAQELTKILIFRAM